MAEQEEPVRRRVALKIIKLGMDTRTVIARFEAERQALALMDHPNIAKVFDAGSTERPLTPSEGERVTEGRVRGSATEPIAAGRPYFVMELVRGVKITEYCDEKNLATPQRLELFIKVCQAVQHAHQKGIIHRDLKPSNVLVTVNDGVAVPKIIDFGIAKATGDQRLTDKTVFTAFEQFLGTPAYMSPEQAELSSVDIDTRSDIYSLGVLLYELLTGKTPFESKDLLQLGLDEMRRTIREKEPPTPSTRVSSMDGEELTTTAKRRGLEPPKLINQLRGDLDWIVMKCLEKDRARRYETAKGLATDVQRHLSNEPVVAGPPNPAYRLGKFVRRNKGAVLAVAVVAAALLFAVVLSTWEARQQSRLRLQARMEAAKSQQVAKFLKDMLAGVGPSVAQGRDTKLLREILDKTAERVGKELTNEPEVEIELLTTLASTYDELALYTRTEEVAQKSVKLARARPGGNDRAVALALLLLGEAQRHLGKFEQAESTQREALALRRKLLGGQQVDVAESLNSLAEVFEDRGRLAEAEATFRESLAIAGKVSGNESLDVAVSLHNLATVLDKQGKLAEAETTYRQALAICEKLAAQEHPQFARALNGLAVNLSEQGRLGEAEAMDRQALALFRKLQGNEDPLVAGALLNLASVLGEENKLAEAEVLVREAIEMQKKLLSSEHPDVATSLNNLGSILQHQRRLAEAEKAYREALEMRRALLGHKHPDIAGSLHNLACVLYDQGKLAEAEPLFREAIVMARELLSNDHPHLAIALDSLARTILRQGRPSEAETLEREALAIRRRKLGDEHPLVKASLDWLVAMLRSQDKLAEVEGLQKEQLASMRTRLSTDDPELAGAVARLADTLLAEAKFTDAEPLARESLIIREKQVPDDWRTFNSRRMLGASLSGQKRYVDAEPLLTSAYEGMKAREDKMPSDAQPRLKEALQGLVELYEAMGQSDQAADWKKKLEEFGQAQSSKAPPTQPDTKPPP
jgi:tetratricopeptide (TPR) repeat protein